MSSFMGYNKDLPSSPQSGSILPQIDSGKHSRNRKSVTNRSLQMLKKMRDLSHSFENLESTRVRVRKSVQEIMQVKPGHSVNQHSSFVRKTKNEYSQFLSVAKKRRGSNSSSIFSDNGSSALSVGEQVDVITEDRQRLRNLIRLCMNEDYSKAQEEELQRKQRRNKATFASAS